eukprot:15350075-Ditylum_brightwellii.AAC.1
MKVFLVQNSQVIKHLEKQGSLLVQKKKSKEQAAGRAIVELSLQLFLFTAQKVERPNVEKM